MVEEPTQAADSATVRTQAASHITTAGAVGVKIFLINENSLARSGLAGLLAGQRDFQLIGEAATLPEASQSGSEPDIYLVEAPTLTREIIAAIGRLTRTRRGSTVPTLILTVNTADFAFELLRIGAYVVDSRSLGVSELVAIIRTTAAGYGPLEHRLASRLAGATNWLNDQDMKSRLEHTLTRRELEVFTLLALGMTNAEIAESLTVAISTIKSYVKEILSKLGLRDRRQLIVYAHTSAASHAKQ